MRCQVRRVPDGPKNGLPGRPTDLVLILPHFGEFFKSNFRQEIRERMPAAGTRKLHRTAAVYLSI